jgi:hypothetical protein
MIFTPYKLLNCYLSVGEGAMIGKNQLLFTDEPIEFEK